MRLIVRRSGAGPCGRQRSGERTLRIDRFRTASLVRIRRRHDDATVRRTLIASALLALLLLLPAVASGSTWTSRQQAKRFLSDLDKNYVANACSLVSPQFLTSQGMDASSCQSRIESLAPEVAQAHHARDSLRTVRSASAHLSHYATGNKLVAALRARCPQLTIKVGALGELGTLRNPKVVLIPREFLTRTGFLAESRAANGAIYQFTYRSGQKLSWVKRVGTPQPVLIETATANSDGTVTVDAKLEGQPVRVTVDADGQHIDAYTRLS